MATVLRMRRHWWPRLATGVNGSRSSTIPLPYAGAVLALLGPIANRMTDELPRLQELTKDTQESLARSKQLVETLGKLRENVAGNSGPVRDVSLGELADWSVDLVVREAREFARPQDRVAFMKEVWLRLEPIFQGAFEGTVSQKKAS